METLDAYFSAIGNPHNPLQKDVKDTKRCRLGWSKSWTGQAEDSVLQVCQLTELKQTTEWERYPNRFPHLYETLLPENLRKYCRQWPAGKTETETKLLIQENSKPLDLIMYSDDSVTKDQSGWGFTVKQGATTIHEDSAACMVSTSSLTMKVEAVTCVLRWIASRGDSQTTRHHPHRFNELATKSEKWNGKPTVECVDGQHPPSKTPVGVLPWTCRSERK